MASIIQIMYLIDIIYEMKEHTTISIKPKTLESLAEICKKNQSYDKLIQELIKNWSENN